jgi:hypothetical protein
MTPRRLTSLLTGLVTLALVGAPGHAQEWTPSRRTGALFCQALTSVVDAAVQNQWNVVSCAIPANTLARNGDSLVVELAWHMAANTNTKRYQLYWSLASAVCSGTDATLCTSGCQLATNSTALSAVSAVARQTITRTAVGAQTVYGFQPLATSNQRTDAAACTIDETAAAKITWGIRNEDAAAGSADRSILNIWKYGAP